MIYRINFLITLVSMGFWIIIYVLFFEVLFLHIDNLAGWTKSELLIFLGFYYFSQAIGNVFFRESFEQIGEEIRRGNLDQALIKPASTQVLIFFRAIRFDHIIDFFLVFILFAYAFATGDIVASPTLFGLGLILAILGNFLFYGILICITSLLFFVEKLDGLASLMWHASQISRYPRQIFTGIGKTIFQFVIPLSLIVSLPSELALGKIDMNLLLFLIFITIFIFTFGNIIFRIGLGKYTSSN